MDRTTPLGSNRTGSGSGANPGSAKVEDVAHAAHQATDRIADKAASQVDRLSGTAHRAASASIRERPIAIVAGALVIGYLLGRIGN